MDFVAINKPDPSKKTICIIAEGSYPYITGGVSAWIQDIITGLTNYNFIIFAISAEEDEPKYLFPPNVIGLVNRLLTAPVEKPKKSIQSSFFSNIESFHNDMMQKKDFSRFSEIFKLINKHRYDPSSLQRHITSFNIVTQYNAIRNPLYPFSDYYWAWRSSHEYMMKIMTWDLPPADLYHTISTGYAGLCAASAKIKYNKPVILTEHGLYNKEREIDIKRATWVKGYQRDMWINIFNDLSAITYEYSDCVISLFEVNRNIQIAQGAKREKTLVIPNGIEIDRYLDLKTETCKEFSIGIIARVVPIKDVKNFIIMAKIVAESIPNVKFYIIGPTDEDESYYEDCVKLVENFQIQDKVVFTGKADVRQYYKFLDVVVLSSIREAQPLVILEAYAAGIPVVSTRVGNVPEMLDYNDILLADPKDSEKLAQGVIYLYNNPDYRNKLIAANRNKVIQFYNKKDLIATYDNLYAKYIGMYTQ
ncbi:MAG: GT4 family glycosyltransferase PelF [Spirochaetota bacterium]|nr:GT4 family glycosyltransferase PelF [Spirochaetota bacterium]